MADDLQDMTDIGNVLKRLNLVDLGTVNNYKKWAKNAGLEFVDFVDHSRNLQIHYQNVKFELIEKGDELKLSKEYQTNMKEGLTYWVNNSKAGK